MIVYILLLNIATYSFLVFYIHSFRINENLKQKYIQIKLASIFAFKHFLFVLDFAIEQNPIGTNCSTTREREKK